jgi:TonB family protein
LSEHNTHAKKETLSRHRRLRYKKPARRPNAKAARQPQVNQRAIPRTTQRQRRLAAMRPSEQTQRPKTSPPKPEQQKTKETRSERPKATAKAPQKPSQKGLQPTEKNKKPGKGKRLRLAFGDPKHRPERKTAERQEKGDPTPNSPQAVARPAIQIKPSFGALSPLQGAPAPEHLPDIREGEETALNSRKWLFASFFNRVKRFVSQHWDPATRYRKRDPYGNIYGIKDRLTVLSITLKQDGSLLSASVAKSSGLRFLDQEAIRAFQAAQPFHNPPKELADADGKIRFRFSFFVYNSHRARFRVFR